MQPVGSFFQVDIRQIQNSLEDSVSELCFEAGASGVAQDLKFRQPDLVYDPEIIDTSKIDLSAYFNQRPTEDLLAQIQSLDPEAQVLLLERPNEDWMEGWKKHFQAFQLTGPYWIVPSWLPTPKEAQKVLRIDPGMAFGTGTHATTQIASRMILDSMSVMNVNTAIDVGTGTGVLAMLMAFEGVEKVECTEIDPIARETAMENLELNHLANVIVHDCQIENLTEPYDLVVANIIDGVLVRLREDLYRLVKPGGMILVTGILEERKNEFLVQFQQGFNLDLLKEQGQDEWRGYLFRRNA